MIARAATPDKLARSFNELSPPPLLLKKGGGGGGVFIKEGSPFSISPPPSFFGAGGPPICFFVSRADGLAGGGGGRGEDPPPQGGGAARARHILSPPPSGRRGGAFSAFTRQPILTARALLSPSLIPASIRSGAHEFRAALSLDACAAGDKPRKGRKGASVQLSANDSGRGWSAYLCARP